MNISSGMRHVLALICAVFVTQALAQESGAFPSRPVTFVVQQSPGSTGDLVARALSEVLAKRWGVGVVVENKPGANGMVASSLVARAKPDGYTLLVSGSTPLAFNPHLYSNVPYDLRKDFTYIAPIQDAPFVLLASPKSKLIEFAQLVSVAQRKPESLTFASGGVGNSTHLVMEMLADSAKVKVRHIPFNGVGPAMLSTISGETDLMVSVLPSAVSQIASGRVVALAVSGGTRVPQLANVPTFVELGIQGPPTPGSLVLIGPAQMPMPLVDRINADVRVALQDKGLLEKFQRFNTQVFSGPPFAGAERFMREYEEWGAFIKSRGIQGN